MNELERTRQHASEMAGAQHRTTCCGQRRDRWGVVNVRPDPDCTGCLPESERALWRQIADEISTYLASDEDQEALL